MNESLSLSPLPITFWVDEKKLSILKGMFILLQNKIVIHSQFYYNTPSHFLMTHHLQVGIKYLANSWQKNMCSWYFEIVDSILGDNN